MNMCFSKHLRISFLFLLPISALQQTAKADPVLVRAIQGTVHGFLELRSDDGQVVATGDSFQTVRGSRVTSRTIFHFKDGSVDQHLHGMRKRRPFLDVVIADELKGVALREDCRLIVDRPNRTGPRSLQQTSLALRLP